MYACMHLHIHTRVIVTLTYKLHISVCLLTAVVVVAAAEAYNLYLCLPHVEIVFFLLVRFSYWRGMQVQNVSNLYESIYVITQERVSQW